MLQGVWREYLLSKQQSLQAFRSQSSLVSASTQAADQARHMLTDIPPRSPPLQVAYYGSTPQQRHAKELLTEVQRELDTLLVQVSWRTL